MNKLKLKLISFLFLVFLLVFLFFQVAKPSFSQLQLPGLTMSAAWPSDFPIYPGATDPTGGKYPVYGCAQGRCQTIHVLFTSASPQAILAWYKSEMPKNGWAERKKALEGIPVPISGAVFSKQKADGCYMGLVSTGTDKGQTYIQLTYANTGEPVCEGVQALTPTPPPGEEEKPSPPGICEYPEEVERERREIKQRIKEKHGIKVVDSNLCDQAACGDNTNYLPWTVEELLRIEATLDNLPICFLQKAKVSQITGRIKNGIINAVHKKICCGEEAIRGLAAYASCVFLDNKITICGRNFQERGLTLGDLLNHQLADAFQWNGAFPGNQSLPGGVYTNPVMIDWLVETDWSQDATCLPFFGCLGINFQPPPDLPTDYARKTKNPTEDLAESVRLYVTSPDILLAISARRYNFIKDKIMCGTEFK